VHRIGRCGPGVIAHIQFVPQSDELFGHGGDELLRRNTLFLGRSLHFLPVLIDAGEKENIFTLQPMIARDDIGQHFLVGMPYMRRRVGVIDRGGDEEGFRH
jgi:hypothetical protein